MSMILALLIGPYKCGKTTFAMKIQEFYRKNVLGRTTGYHCHVLFYEGDKRKEFQIENRQNIRKYLLSTLMDIANRRRPWRTVIMCDYNVAGKEDRLEVFKLCAAFNITYLQVWFRFNPQDIFERNYQELQEAKLSFIQMLTHNCTASVPRRYNIWEQFNVQVMDRFLIDRGAEITRFHLYIEALFRLVNDPIASTIPILPMPRRDKQKQQTDQADKEDNKKKGAEPKEYKEKEAKPKEYKEKETKPKEYKETEAKPKEYKKNKPKFREYKEKEAKPKEGDKDNKHNIQDNNVNNGFRKINEKLNLKGPNMHRHEYEMQAGVLYRDKVLLKPKKKNL